MIRLLKEWLSPRKKWSLCGGAAILLAILYVIRDSNSEWGAAAALLALGAIIMFDCMNLRTEGEGSRGPAWMLLIAALLASGCPGVHAPLVHKLLLIVFFTAAVIRTVGLASALLLLPACFVLLVILPFRSTLMLYISYPLRMVSAALSGYILQLFHAGIVWTRTTVILPDAHIAITDACSGIAQVEAMLLLAYLAVRRERCLMLWRVLHYLFLFPAIILANVLRIVVTVLLYRQIGEIVFNNTIHTLLGYSQVIVTMALFLGAGLFLPDLPSDQGGTKQ